MSKIILKQLKRDDIDNILSQLFKACHDFDKLNIRREDLIISMPEYFKNIVQYNYRFPFEYPINVSILNTSPFPNPNISVSEERLNGRFAGINIQPSPDNNITVFHTDSPLYEHLAPIIIDLNNL